MDQTKACLPDVRHRAILHSSFGCFLAEQVFGHILTLHSAEADRALRAFKHDPSEDNAQIYREAKAKVAVIPDKKEVCVRDIIEDHIIEDLGFIPDISRWLKKLPIEPWMAGGVGAFKKESQPHPVD